MRLKPEPTLSSREREEGRHRDVPPRDTRAFEGSGSRSCAYETFRSAHDLANAGWTALGHVTYVNDVGRPVKL